MDIRTMIIFTLLILSFDFIISRFFKNISRYLNNKNILEEMQIKNKQYELFMHMDPKLAEEEIDNLIKKYINEYVLSNFIVNKINYIKKPQVDQMIKTLDKVLILEISELYIFYIKTLTNIRNEDDLLNYIDKKVKEHVLEFVTEFNKPIDDLVV